MDAKPLPELDRICAAFQCPGVWISSCPIPSGHINDTYCSEFEASGRRFKYVNQRINHHVFREPEKLMENVERVTRFARQRIEAEGGDADRRTLTIIPARDGKSFYRSPEGDYWRMFRFISGARTYDQVEDVRHVYAAARAFGRFQKMLARLPGERLHETIPGFHHTRGRYQAFLAAVERDAAGRAASVRPEIDFVLAREKDAGVVVDGLAAGRIPERVTHNDTKLNNVMIDDATGEGICVIDLDTVMPGSVLYDFGDSVRLGAATAAEDERDLAKVGFDLGMFDRLAAGYLDAARDFLVPAETELLAFSAGLLTLECGIRFLTDHLQGDVYFKIHRPGHNLDRARTQFRMVAEMERRQAAMEAVVGRYL
ncbi:MAG TPA: aminoglycoside phosphotransferase family protein [Candidatus Aminicenantes bacterium]|nr:aminoglycoside phosphotransferase family protein [Candidatus Aminicenantes bacterium]HRY65877.1 aminoglycoside phosphotransferase family protein [Candidatus Aminicenantes bacterium]HRZ72797.1 aminoglycoside phosphotransferase family protein [Candidatus Aminicenantes bacterium]